MDSKFNPKNEAISNVQIENICRHYGIQLNGVYMKDEIHDLQVGNYIINLQNHNQAGSH